jgi:Undecaprenyl-phosphate galactose phosphotransferase WbaP
LSTASYTQTTIRVRRRALPTGWPTIGLLVSCDVLSLAAASVLASALWGLVNPAVPSLHLAYWPALTVFITVYALEGVYPGVGMNPVEELKRLVSGTSMVYLVLTAGIFLAKDVGLHSRGVFACSWLLAIVLVPATRTAVRRTFGDRSWWGVPAVILGAGTTGQSVVRQLQTEPSLCLKPVAFLDDSPDQEGRIAGVPLVGPLALAGQIARQERVRYAIIAMPELDRERMLGVLEQCSRAYSHVILVPNLFGVATLWVTARDLGGVLGLELRYNLLIPLNRWIKRGLDIVLGSAALLVSGLAVGVAALLVKAISPGPAFYKQKRIGLGGRAIEIPKLRTMQPDADTMLARHLEENQEARREWAKYCKLRRDPRVIPWVGRILRRMSVDELPQLWSVLKGEMSLVGPRPFPEYHTERFDASFQKLRQQVVPGLTGLWQISARSDGDIAVQAALDTYYIRNWSFWLDIYILLRTIRVVLTGRGAY